MTQADVPEQLIFELVPAQAPAFENFLSGANDELIDVLARAARGEVRETGIVLWGAHGAGKTHLLQAAVQAATHAGRCASYAPGADAAPAEPPEPGALVAVDDIERASHAAQARLFTLYNALAGSSGQLLVAADAPPARLSLRDDLRTRLGYGLVYELLPLTDAIKPAALQRYASARGVSLAQDVIDYLLAHYPRDMRSLLRALDALDRRSLASKRPITVPFVRAFLARDDA